MSVSLNQKACQTVRRRGSQAALLWAIGGLLLGGFLIGGGSPRPSIAKVGVPTASSVPAAKFKSIEDVELGDRVVGRNPIREQVEGMVPAPATWKKIGLRMNKEDGSLLRIELLRPQAWIDAEKVAIGRVIHLEFDEMGAVGDAEVTAVGPCPSIRPGTEPIVTGKFAHQTDGKGGVIGIRLEGQELPTHVTSKHCFWSVDRRKFIAAGDLREGEQVDTLQGARRVASATPVAYAGVLYNLETTEHVFRVGSLATLVHNTCTVIGRMEDLTRFTPDNNIDTWWKSGRLPTPNEPAVSWLENRRWLDERIARGDTFGIATNPYELSREYIPGSPNGYFTWREYDYLTSKGIEVSNFFGGGYW